MAIIMNFMCTSRYQVTKRLIESSCLAKLRTYRLHWLPGVQYCSSMSSSFMSSSVLVHVAGVIAVSHLFLVGKYRQEFFDSLNQQNATKALHEALDRFADSLSLVFPAGRERASTAIGGVVFGRRFLRLLLAKVSHCLSVHTRCSSKFELLV